MEEQAGVSCFQAWKGKSLRFLKNFAASLIKKKIEDIRFERFSLTHIGMLLKFNFLYHIHDKIYIFIYRIILLKYMSVVISLLERNKISNTLRLPPMIAL